MKCVCKSGETRPGHTTVTLERNEGTLVVRRVPAEVCENCGESYVSAEVTRSLRESAEKTLKTEIDIREFAATSTWFEPQQ